MSQSCSTCGKPAFITLHHSTHESSPYPHPAHLCQPCYKKAFRPTKHDVSFLLPPANSVNNPKVEVRKVKP